MSAVPEPLEPLVTVLPKVTQHTLEAALKASALHLQKRDAEIDAAGVREALGSCDVPTKGMKKILAACNWLLKQAGKGGGQSPAKLKSSLGPLGFEEHHIAAVLAVLQWVKDGSVVEDEVQADAGALDAGGGAGASGSAAAAEPEPDRANDANAANTANDSNAAAAPAKKKKSKKPPPAVEPAPAEPARSEADEEQEGGGDPMRDLHWAALSGEDSKVSAMLRKVGMDIIDGQDSRGYTAYHHACANGHAAVVQLLVDQGCSTDQADNFGRTGWQVDSPPARHQAGRPPVPKHLDGSCGFSIRRWHSPSGRTKWVLCP